MYAEEFIYIFLYNQKETNTDLSPVLQPWCENLIVFDIIYEKFVFRKREDITLYSRKIQDYE